MGAGVHGSGAVELSDHPKVGLCVDDRAQSETEDFLVIAQHDAHRNIS